MNLMLADPTGISSMIYSFAKYAPCTVEDLAVKSIIGKVPK